MPQLWEGWKVGCKMELLNKHSSIIFDYMLFRSSRKWFWSVWWTQHQRSSFSAWNTCTSTKLAWHWWCLRSFCGRKHMETINFLNAILCYIFWLFFRHSTIYLFTVKSYASQWLCANCMHYDVNVGLRNDCHQNGFTNCAIEHKQFVGPEKNCFEPK